MPLSKSRGLTQVIGVLEPKEDSNEPLAGLAKLPKPVFSEYQRSLRALQRPASSATVTLPGSIELAVNDMQDSVFTGTDLTKEKLVEMIRGFPSVPKDWQYLETNLLDHDKIAQLMQTAHAQQKKEVSDQIGGCFSLFSLQ